MIFGRQSGDRWSKEEWAGKAGPHHHRLSITITFKFK
jgi:hypothetical protein